MDDIPIVEEAKLDPVSEELKKKLEMDLQAKNRNISRTSTYNMSTIRNNPERLKFLPYEDKEIEMINEPLEVTNVSKDGYSTANQIVSFHARNLHNLQFLREKVSEEYLEDYAKIIQLNKVTKIGSQGGYVDGFFISHDEAQRVASELATDLKFDAAKNIDEYKPFFKTAPLKYTHLLSVKDELDFNNFGDYTLRSGGGNILYSEPFFMKTQLFPFANRTEVDTKITGTVENLFTAIGTAPLLGEEPIVCNLLNTNGKAFNMVNLLESSIASVNYFEFLIPKVKVTTITFDEWCSSDPFVCVYLMPKATSIKLHRNIEINDGPNIFFNNEEYYTIKPNAQIECGFINTGFIGRKAGLAVDLVHEVEIVKLNSDKSVSFKGEANEKSFQIYPSEKKLKASKNAKKNFEHKYIKLTLKHNSVTYGKWTVNVASEQKIDYTVNFSLHSNTIASLIPSFTNIANLDTIYPVIKQKPKFVNFNDKELGSKMMAISFYKKLRALILKPMSMLLKCDKGIITPKHLLKLFFSFQELAFVNEVRIKLTSDTTTEQTYKLQDYTSVNPIMIRLKEEINAIKKVFTSTMFENVLASTLVKSLEIVNLQFFLTQLENFTKNGEWDIIFRALGEWNTVFPVSKQETLRDYYPYYFQKTMGVIIPINNFNTNISNVIIKAAGEQEIYNTAANETWNVLLAALNTKATSFVFQPAYMYIIWTSISYALYDAFVNTNLDTYYTIKSVTVASYESIKSELTASLIYLIHAAAYSDEVTAKNELEYLKNLMMIDDFSKKLKATPEYISLVNAASPFISACVSVITADYIKAIFNANGFTYGANDAIKIVPDIAQFIQDLTLKYQASLQLDYLSLTNVINGKYVRKLAPLSKTLQCSPLFSTGIKFLITHITQLLRINIIIEKSVDPSVDDLGKREQDLRMRDNFIPKEEESIPKFTLKSAEPLIKFQKCLTKFLHDWGKDESSGFAQIIEDDKGYGQEELNVNSNIIADALNQLQGNKRTSNRLGAKKEAPEDNTFRKSARLLKKKK